MMDMRRELQHQSYSSGILSQWFKRLLPAQILAAAVPTLGNIINGLLVGNWLNADALVALGFVMPISAILGALSSVISGGARIVCGRFIGRGEKKGMDEALTVSVAVLTLLGLVLTVLMLLFAEAVARLFGADGASVIPTAQYIRGLSFGFVPSLLTPCLMVFLQMGNRAGNALEAAVILAAVSLAAGLINVRMGGGVFGMGIASSVSQTFALLFVVLCFRKAKDGLMHVRRGYFRRSLCGEICRLGSPTALAGLLYAIRNVCINSAALQFGGEEAVASLAILNSCGGLFDSVNLGVGAVALILASVFVGEKDSKALQKLVGITMRVGLVLAFCKVILIALFGRQIAVFFGAEGGLISATYKLLVYYSACMPVNIVLVAFVSPLQSLGRIKLSNTLYLFGALLIPLGCCYLLGPVMGVEGIWSCYAVADMLQILMIGAVAWKQCGHLPRTAADWISLQRDMGTGAKYCVSLRSMEDVINVSEELIGFCTDNGIDGRRSRLCGLCLEEMAGNVITHGFPKGKRNDYTVDIFVCCEAGELFMRLRDNAPPFDPVSRLGTSADDPCKNIGIRMVSRLSKEMNYQQFFGMNVVSIRL